MSKTFWKQAIAAFAVAAVPAFSQDPISHKVNFPVGDAAWTVVLNKIRKSAESQAATAPKRGVKSIDIVRLGKLRRDTIHWSDDTTTEYWWLNEPPIILMRGKPGEKIRSIRANLIGARSFDASTFDWVGEKTFLGTDSFKGKKVQGYRMEIPIEDGEFTVVNALIDQETGQPLMWSDSSTEAVFSFSEGPPSDPLVMPPDFQKAFKSYETLYAPAKKTGKR